MEEGILVKDSIQTVVSQIFIMFLLMFLGHLLYRRKMIDERFSKQLSALLLNIVTPAVLIISYQRPFDKEDARQLALAFFYSAVTFAIAIVAAWLLFGRSQKPYAKDARMCVIFSNNGFMAIPLLQALLGAEGVFLGSASIVSATVIAWTYGARMLSGERGTDFKKILLNPGTLALAGGVLLFCSPWKLPGPIFQAAEYLRAEGVEPEYEDRDYVVLMASGSTGEEAFERAADALQSAVSRRPVSRPALPPARGERALSVREALFAPREAVAAEESLGRICGAPTVSCPPAIPVAVSGERIGPEALALFRHYGVETVDVVREERLSVS